MFDTAKSSTYVDLNETLTIAFETGGGVNPIVSDDEYVLWLLTGQDTVTVGGIAVPNVELYTVINQTTAFDSNPYSGIQGQVICSEGWRCILKPYIGMSSEAQGFFEGLMQQGLLG